MDSVMRYVLNMRRSVIAGAAAFVSVGCASLVAAVAQTLQPGEVPFLNYAPAVPTSPPAAPARVTPPAPRLELRPSSVPTAKETNAKDASPATKEPVALDALKQRDQELNALRNQQRRALENEAKLKRDIESIAGDRRKFNAQLIESAERVRAIEAAIIQANERIQPLDNREQAIRKSLEDRRGVIGEVLAALQRIGRRPPPVILGRPEDALESLRTAIMLGSVLPGMRQQTEALSVDLSELARVRKDIADERERLERDLKMIADEGLRLTMLTEQRQKQLQDVEKNLAAEHQRATQIGRDADNLKDLIGGLERNLDGTTRATRVAARANDEKKALDIRTDAAAVKDLGRLAPAIAFASAKKRLPLPVNGVKIREFGASDGLGGAEKGLSIATRNASTVTAPCDGWVVYAGPFRNYGQLLILNAGDGYHVLLAGMEQISVDLGQFVVTGEPVAVMGSRAQASASVTAGSGQPVLYVEFRKDGTPVDPGPWWAASEVEKVRG
jgi:septal ring factor EnvC (AmiA/AmiB activator)